MIHASLPKDMACVGCHRNLVHSRPGSQTAADEIAAIKRAMNDSVHSSHLANHHLQKGLTCSSCHGNDLIPDANATSINAQCATCHGGMEKVAASHKGPSYLNPHASHLGNIACGSCHFAHQELKAYCLNCHTNFDMPMRGRATSAKAQGATGPPRPQAVTGLRRTHMKRRDVLKLVAASAVAKPSVVLAAAGQNTKADIVIIGAGGAGYSAAVTAHDPAPR